jgi:hypothetical protein
MRSKMLFLIISSLLSSWFLFGCSKSPTLNQQISITTPLDNSQIQNPEQKATGSTKVDYKIIGSLPQNWVISVSGETEGSIFKEGKPAGKIEVVGYYGEPVGLPNHSTLIKSEDVNSGLGKGKLYLLDQSDPAAASANRSWIKIYVLIPIKDQRLAYSIWVDTDKKQLVKDTKAIEDIIKNLKVTP